MPVNVHNEWDNLKEIIVGKAVNARYPNKDETTYLLDYKDDYKDISEIPSGYYDPKVVDEAEEDLEHLVTFLQSVGVTVKRPSTDYLESSFGNGLWNATPEHVYCPRDSIVTIGNTIIETPMVSRNRYFETFAFREIIKEYFDQGSRWLSAPKPQLSEKSYNLDAKNGYEMLTEFEPLFDAANIIRLGEDILYLVSRSGNKLGAKWLQSILGSQYRVHLIEGSYDGTHIDTTIALVRPGLVILNPDRIRQENLPAFMQSWDVIYADEMVDVGFSGEKPRASVAQAINTIMVNPALALVEQSQKPLIKKLNSFGVEVEPLSMRQSRTLSGGFHCTTLDISRDGKLENYS